MTDYAISALSALAAGQVATGDLLAVVDVSDTTTPPAGAAGSDKKATVAALGRGVTQDVNLVRDYGAKLDGSASIATAMSNLCTDAAANPSTTWSCTIPAGVYKVTAPFNSGSPLPNNLQLRGAGAIGGDVSNQYNGTVLAVDSSFSGGSYVLACQNNSDHSTANGPLLSGLMFSGKDFTGSAVDAIDLTGPVMCKFRDLVIAVMSGNGINTHPDLSAAEIGCFGQDWDSIFIDSCAGIGARLIYTEDSTFRNVYIIGCAQDNWQICGADNTHMDHCRAEWSGGAYGLHLTNISDGGTAFDWTYATGQLLIDNFSTDANNQSGIRIDGSWTTGQGAGTGPCTIMFTSLANRRDGKQNAGAVGSWAGFDIDYSAVPGGSLGLPVYINGIAQMTGIGDGGTGAMSPRYGVRVNATGPAPVKFGSVGQVWGYDTAVNLGGTHTNYSLASSIDQVTGNNYSYTG